MACMCVYLPKRVYFPVFSSLLWFADVAWTLGYTTCHCTIASSGTVQWPLMLSVVFTHIGVVMLKLVNPSCCSYRCYTNPFPTSDNKFYPGTRTDSWGRRQIAMQLARSKKHDPYQHQRAVTAPTGLSFHLLVAGLREQRLNVKLWGAEYFLGLENIFLKSKLLYNRLLSSC